MLRLLGFTGAVFAAVLAFASPVRAQGEVYGAYCGEVTWRGQAPIDTWVIFMTENRWSSPVSAGPFTDASDGTRSQDGTMITMRSNAAPNYTIVASAMNGRIVGEVTAADGRLGTISMTQMTGSGVGLRSSPIPPDFASEAAQQAVNGDIDGLQGAITWAWTPQGSAYWRALAQSGQPLPDHARAALQDWIRREQAGEQPGCDAQ
jgi:hypothetical protein